MKIIVNVNKRWAIGRSGGLLYNIPEDMRFFRETTSGRTVVMGRTTLRSLPGGAPLKNRKNIILTHNPPEDMTDAVFCKDLSELAQAIKKENPDDVFVIGGGMIYKMMLPYCAEAYVTVVEDYSEGDAYFPDLDSDAEWHLSECSEKREYNGLKYEFRKYLNDNVREI